jgi:Domain of unknown function (DUF5916)/Carbohydrate family 9 binding domain-like
LNPSTLRPLLAALIPLCATSLAAQVPADSAAGAGAAPALPVAHALRIRGSIRIDGRLDEPAWTRADSVWRFTQVDPVEGAPVSQRTVVWILYDDQALYIGARLYDTGPITTRLGRRDMDLGDADWFGVKLDSYHDRRTAFGFDVDPSGVQRDEAMSTSRDGQLQDDNSWDAVWDVKTRVDSAGWTVEERIPFSQLRFSPAESQTWGLLLERTIGRNHEYAVSAFTPKSEQGGIARYGLLEGLRGVEPGKRLELLPYVVAKGSYLDESADPFRTDAQQSASGGLDLHYRVTPDLTVNATINPDFGQVEVDPAVVNLGVYETYFPEKRPFFVEGSEIFDFNSGGGGQLFYTRRIGRPPQLAPNAELYDEPAVTTILGAAKLSGKTANGWSLGGLEAVTGRERARYIDGDGVARSMIVEPPANYFVARARKELDGGASSVGGLFTAVNRDLTTPALRDALRSAAYTAGVDFQHQWDHRSWIVQGSLALSRVQGDSTAITAVEEASNHFFQRPDAPQLTLDSSATSLTGLSAQLSVGRQAARHWVGSINLATTTPGFEVNDIGYSYRTDRRDFELDASYLENRPGTIWHNWSLSQMIRFEFNYADQLIANWFTTNAHFQDKNYWSVYLIGSYSLRANDDRLTRGGPLATRPANWFGQVDFSSDVRKPVTVDVGGGFTGDEFGGWSTNIGVTIDLKTSPRWDLSIGPQLDRAYAVAQYVTTVPDPTATATYGNRYVFAPLQQTTLSMVTRFNFTFTPKLSLQTYVQPFLSSADYGAPKALAAARSYSFTPYGGSVPNLDFNLRSLRGNAVLRWEWRPGSTLYVAWQQTRQDFATGIGDFQLDRDRSALFRTRPDNIFLVKVNYWLNP